MTRRSLLFSPGDSPKLLKNALTTDADVLAFDLEDAVAPSQKDDARKAVSDVLTDLTHSPDAEICARLTAQNPSADIAALAASPVDALMLPKVADVETVEQHVQLCENHDLDVAIFALLETAAGILHAEAIASHEATEAILFGAEDLAADIGTAHTQTGDQATYARQHVVLAAAAAEIDALDTVYTEFNDPDGMKSATNEACDLGYDGKAAIHPSQVPIINAAFAPDPEQVEWAQKVVRAQSQAAQDGSGVSVVDGEMIDPPIVRRAERILSRADAAEPSE